MRLVVEGETELRLVTSDGAGLEIESAVPGIGFSPLHMLAGSLATCTLSVLAGWAVQVGIPIDDLEIRVTWDYVPDPHRVGAYDMEIHWPGLPPNRREAALRVARACTVEHTLRHPPEIRAEIV